MVHGGVFHTFADSTINFNEFPSKNENLFGNMQEFACLKVFFKEFIEAVLVTMSICLKVTSVYGLVIEWYN